MQSRLADIAEIFGAISTEDVTPGIYHYQAPDKTAPPYIVWSEDDRTDLAAGNIHAEKAWQGTVDLFTVTEFDELADVIEQALDTSFLSWSYEGTDYEEATGLIHHQWVWSY